MERLAKLAPRGFDVARQGLSFLRWIETDGYDLVDLEASFQSTMLGHALTERVLRRE